MKISLLISLLLFIASVTFAQSEEDLAKATQNPLAAMYSLPFQNNTTYGVGAFERPQNVLNIQPVIPFSLSEKVNIINRIIADIPAIYLKRLDIKK